VIILILPCSRQNSENNMTDIILFTALSEDDKARVRKKGLGHGGG
jgi:hypothetical protein